MSKCVTTISLEWELKEYSKKNISNLSKFVEDKIKEKIVKEKMKGGNLNDEEFEETIPRENRD